ncbi:hypothetical protein KJ618_02480 [Patescibacteria group bacterium]|nr:hypothetical protein [Patescibacteria group bacterium]
MKRVWFFIAIIPAIIAARALFSPGFIHTHDGEYHIIRIVEFARMLSAGYWFPRWAPTLNSGYGIPIFQYHYPLPNYIGSFVRLFTHDAVYAFQISMGLGYIFASFGSFLWLTSLYGSFAALLGAVAGAFVPYWFVDIYVRGSIGEVWAMALLFFILWAIEKKRYVYTALLYGLLLLSHNILGMVFTPFLFIYMVIRNIKGIGSLMWGIGLSAYFWLPALWEQQYVVGLNTVNFREHFVALYELLIPSWGTEFSGGGFGGNKISFQLGVIPIIIIVASFATFIRRKEKQSDILARWFLLLVGLILVFILPWSKGIWEVVLPLQFIQYPWRLLSFMIPATAFLTAYLTRKSKTPYGIIVLAIMGVIVTFSYTRKVQYAPRNEAYYTARSNFTDGTSSMGNSFSTIWTGWKDTRPESAVEINGGQLVRQIRWKYLDKSFVAFMSRAGEVTINTLYFPGWIAMVDGVQVPISYEHDGVIHVRVAEGEHVIEVRFVNTLPRTIGNIVSFVSLAMIASWGILRYISRKYENCN